MDLKKSRVFNLNSMINYNEGSVVSRTILREKSGTITMFAFDEGEGLSEHVVPYDAYLYIVEGKLTATVKNRPAIKCSQRDFVYVPANIPHAVKADEQCKMFLIMIRSQEKSLNVIEKIAS